MKTFKQFKQIAYSGSKQHTVYNPVTGKKTQIKVGKAMAKRSSSSAAGDE